MAMTFLRVSVAVLSIAMSTAAGGARAESRSAQSDSLSFVRGASVFLISRDGRNQSRVVRGIGTGKLEKQIWYSDPAWSTNGRLAVTVTTFSTGHDDAEVMVFARPRWISVPANGGAIGGIPGNPSWAPDGRRIVLVVHQSGIGGGLSMSRPGSKTAVALTPVDLDGPYDGEPAWSPNGSVIAFAREGRTTTLYMIRPNGRELRQVTTTAARNPSWSPDSKRLVFDDERRIAVIDVDGGNLRYLTNPSSRDGDPAWSPSGDTIAFVRYRSKRSETGDLWLMDASGRGKRLLVRDASQPAWKRGR
jgi:WD40 repeat protein